MAFISQGTEFYWSTSTSASTSTTALVGEVIDFSGPGGRANVVDRTHLGSTAREYFVGLRDEGEVTLSMLLNFGDTGQTNMRADRATRTMRKAVIKFSDSTTDGVRTKAIFDAYCLGFTISGGVDAVARAEAVLRITGAVTFSSSIS